MQCHIALFNSELCGPASVCILQYPQFGRHVPLSRQCQRSKVPRRAPPRARNKSWSACRSKPRIHGSTSICIRPPNVITKHAHTVQANNGRQAMFYNIFNWHSSVCQHLLKAWMSASARLVQRDTEGAPRKKNAHFASSCWVASCFLSLYSSEVRLLPTDTGR